MGIKFVVDKLDDVPEPFRPLYAQGDTGKFYAQVEGVVPKERLDEFRNNNIQLTQKLEAYKDLDPVKAKEALDLVGKIDQKKLLDAGKVDEVVAERVKQMREEHVNEIKKRDDVISTQTRQLETLIVDSAVKTAAVAAGVLPSALDDVLLRAKTTFKVKDGNAIALNEKGEVKYDVDGTTPLSIPGWIKNLKKDAPHLFPGSSGGGAGGGRGGTHQDMSKMTATDKISAGLKARASH